MAGAARSHVSSCPKPKTQAARLGPPPSATATMPAIGCRKSRVNHAAAALAPQQHTRRSHGSKGQAPVPWSP